jgi:hypothetical protein
MTRRQSTGYNSRFAKAGVSCFYESEVLNSSFVHLMKFSAEKPRFFAKLQNVVRHCNTNRPNTDLLEIDKIDEL